MTDVALSLKSYHRQFRLDILREWTEITYVMISFYKTEKRNCVPLNWRPSTPKVNLAPAGSSSWKPRSQKVISAVSTPSTSKGNSIPSTPDSNKPLIKRVNSDPSNWKGPPPRPKFLPSHSAVWVPRHQRLRSYSLLTSVPLKKPLQDKEGSRTRCWTDRALSNGSRSPIQPPPPGPPPPAPAPATTTTAAAAVEGDGPTPQQMAGNICRFFSKIKELIIWSWSYLWALWFLLVISVVYYLRGPLKITHNIGMGESTTSTHLFPFSFTPPVVYFSLIFEWDGITCGCFFPVVCQWCRCVSLWICEVQMNVIYWQKAVKVFVLSMRQKKIKCPCCYVSECW